MASGSSYQHGSWIRGWRKPLERWSKCPLGLCDKLMTFRVVKEKTTVTHVSHPGEGNIPGMPGGHFSEFGTKVQMNLRTSRLDFNGLCVTITLVITQILTERVQRG